MSDNHGKPEWELNWEDEQRKEFQRDPAMWLHARHAQIAKWISEQGDRPITEVKTFVQRAAELFDNGLVATRESIILFVAFIAIVGLASAGLWIGIAGVMLVLVIRRWLVWSAQKQAFRLDRFRDRFRRLLTQADSAFAEMLAEDKEFLQKYEDSILYPLAVPEHKRELPSPGKLEHIETLYREYCNSPDHDHVGGPGLPAQEQEKHLGSCDLCQAARRVREHIGDTLSAFEREIARWRQRLVNRIDGPNPEGAIPTKEFVENFRSWRGPLGVRTETDALIEWLRDKGQWTFDQADKMREACREAEPWQSENEYTRRTFDQVSREMEKAATIAGLEDEWKHYDTLLRALWDGQMKAAIKEIRRIVGRSSPEVLFRELAENGYGNLQWVNRELQTLRNYGYRSELMEREVIAAKGFLAKEGWKWDKLYQGELDAARSFVWLEETAKEQRDKGIPCGTRPEPLASRLGRAVGGLFGW